MELVTDFLYTFNIEASRMTVTLSLFFIFLGLLYWFSVYPFSVLSPYGIKHSKTVPFFGNVDVSQSQIHFIKDSCLTSFISRVFWWSGYFESISDIVRTHGKVCGYYYGRKPVVLLAEPDLIKQVMVKEFSSFTNRARFSGSSKPFKDTFLRNERWKRVRSILTPTFSAAKLKEVRS